MPLKLFLNGDENRQITFTPVRLINGGYTGRSQEDVMAHVNELKILGIQAPERTPCFFSKAPHMIDSENRVSVLDHDCSGEAEYVLLYQNGTWYFTCGADVFDKRVEPLDTAKSKHMYSNKIARDVWLLDDVRDHFDQLVMRSWHGEGRAELYQESRLSSILPPDDILRYLAEYGKGNPEEGFILYSGTFPAFAEGMPFTDCFEVELEDPVLKRAISLRYTLSILK